MMLNQLQFFTVYGKITLQHLSSLFFCKNDLHFVQCTDKIGKEWFVQTGTRQILAFSVAEIIHCSFKYCIYTNQGLLM